MARHKNMQWNLPEGMPQRDGSSSHSWESIYTSLLMDIRDELQMLNKTLACYRVRRMSDDINRIERRLAKRISLKQIKKD